MSGSVRNSEAGSFLAWPCARENARCARFAGVDHAARRAIAAAGHRLLLCPITPHPAHPLGPDSLLWHLAGDWRSGLSGLSAGILQLAWPHLGQGVEEHSAFFDEPWDRIHRSVPQIWATILAPDGDERATTIRDLHRDIKGTDRHGQRYHALNPDTFWWAHATFTWEFFQTVRPVGPPHAVRAPPRAAVPGDRDLVPPLRRQRPSRPGRPPRVRGAGSTRSAVTSSS